MKAVGTLAARELLELRRDGRARVVIVVLIALVLLGAVLGAVRGAAAERDRQAAAKADREIWDGQGEANPHSAAHFSRYVFKPMPALAAFDPGVSDFVGRAIWMEAHNRDPAQFRAAEDDTDARRFGALSPAAALGLFLPLLIIALGYTSVAGERERGSLRMLAAAGISSRQLIAAKLMTVIGVTSLVVVTAVASSLVVGMVAGDPSGGAFTRGGLLVVTYLLYGIGWCGLTIGLSAVLPTTRSALTVLVGLWLVTTLLLPRLAGSVAEQAHPSLAAEAFWSSTKADIRKTSFWGSDDGSKARRAAVEKEAMTQYGVATVKELPISIDALLLQKSEENGDLVFDRMYGERRSTEERRQWTRRAFALAAPTIALTQASRAFAGTDSAHHWHFADAAEAHRRHIIAMLNEDMMVHGAELGYGYTADRALWQQVPDLDYRPPALDDVDSAGPAGLADLALLFFFALGGVLLARRSARRLRLV